MVGSMPGMAASTKLTLALGGLPNSVDEPENSLLSLVTCACTSMPMITSQSPVEPEIRRFLSGMRVSTMVMFRAVLWRLCQRLAESNLVQFIIEAGGDFHATPYGRIAMAFIEAHRPGVAGKSFELDIAE